MKNNSFDNYLEKRLTKQEIAQVEQEALNEYYIVKNLKEQISIEIEKYAKSENIGFNELSRRLGLSASQMIKIRKGEANITLTTLSHIFSILGKQPVLSFNEDDNKKVI